MIAPTCEWLAAPEDMAGVDRQNAGDRLEEGRLAGAIGSDEPEGFARLHAAFGQLGYGIIGGGHKIARFPHPVNGAAANFDLLRRNYVGMTIGAAGAKWTGDNGFGIPGYDPNAILTAEMVDDPAQAIAVMKAMARREAGARKPADR